MQTPNRKEAPAPCAGAIPCPPWLADALDAHIRHRALVLQIAALSDRPTAWAALWLARYIAITAPGPASAAVEYVLRWIRDMLARGPL